MSIPTQKPATTPIPGQLSEHEFTAFILPVWSKNWNFLFHLYLRQRHRLPFGLSSAPPSLILTVDT